jgi:hypothetical protein
VKEEHVEPTATGKREADGQVQYRTILLSDEEEENESLGAAASEVLVRLTESEAGDANATPYLQSLTPHRESTGQDVRKDPASPTRVADSQTTQQVLIQEEARAELYPFNPPPLVPRRKRTASSPPWTRMRTL